VTYGSVPSAAATASSSLNGTVPDSWTLLNNTQVGSISDVGMSYQFVVSGTPGTTAYVDLTSFMQVSGVGAAVGSALSLGGAAGFRIVGPSGTWIETALSGTGAGYLYRQVRDLLGNSDSTTLPAPSSGKYTEKEIVPIDANAVYTIVLYAQASALSQVVTGGNATSGNISAYVDPQLTIDPLTTNAGGYSILYSAGIGSAAPVPEPTSFAMWAAGLFALGGWGLKRRRRQRVTAP